MNSNTNNLAYKILTSAIWSDAEGLDNVPRMPIDDADGYVHLSTAAQLSETLRLHFKGQSDIVILSIRLSDLDGKVKWEPSRGGQLFPHVYGDIPKSAIVSEDRVSVNEDGTCDLPDRLK